MEDLGELLGFGIIFFYGLTVLNFFFKFIMKHFKVQLSKYPKFFSVFKKLFKFFFKNHRWFGFATIILILIHFLIMFAEEGLSSTGLIAAGTMITQVLLGAYGHFFKPKNKIWLWIHRILTIIIAIAIIIHIE